MTLALCIIALALIVWFAAATAFAWLSLWQALMDLPARFLAWLSGRRERREWRRIERARQKQIKDTCAWVRRGER